MTPPDKGGTRALQLLAGLLVSAALVYIAFRKYDMHLVWNAIRTVHMAPLLLAVAIATLPFVLRIPRWKRLLRRDDGTALPTAPLWHATTIGFAANNVLPLRAGEVLRSAAVSRLANVPFATALSSIAVERVLDGLTAVALFGMALVAAHLPSGLSLTPGGTPIATTATKVGIACIVALVMAVVASRYHDASMRLARRVLPSGKVGSALAHFVERVLAGLTALHDPRHALPVIGWSIVIWIVNAAGFYAGFFAFDIHVPFAGAVIMQFMLLVGIALPSTPGFVGVFELAIVGTLNVIYGIDATTALAYALTYHIATFIPITSLGAWSAVTTGVGFRVPADT